MALIKCPECGKEISDKASACIQCGFPIQAVKSNDDHRIAALFDEYVATRHITNSKIDSIYFLVRDEALRIKSSTNTQEAIDKIAKEIIAELTQAKVSVYCNYLDIKLFCELIDFDSLSNETMDYVTDQLVSDRSGGFAFINQYYYPLYLVMQYGSALNRQKLMSLLNNTGYEFIVQRYRETCGQETLQQISTMRKNNCSPKCPVCGSTFIKRISTMNRLGSIATFGLASSKIGKQYECRSCKHKW